MTKYQELTELVNQSTEEGIQYIKDCVRILRLFQDAVMSFLG